MVKIIKAEEQHVEAIGQLWWEFILFHARVDPIWEPADNAIPGFIEHYLRKFMNSDDALILVAVAGEKVVGYAISEIHRISPGLKRYPYGYIDHLAVTESCRRRGIGEKCSPG